MDESIAVCLRRRPEWPGVHHPMHHGHCFVQFAFLAPNPLAEPEPKTAATPPATPDLSGSQEGRNARTEGGRPKMVGSFLVSLLPAFLREVRMES